MKHGLTPLLFVLLLAGCSEHDYYTEAKPVCDYTVPGERVDQGPTPIETTLTPACKTRLESMLPFDDSWSGAPAGLKDRVTEAFQAVLAYPLKLPPENQLLGVAPHSFPDSFLDEIQAEETPMKSLFNHALNLIQTIHYVKSLGNINAQFTPDNYIEVWDGVLTIADGFGAMNEHPYYTTPLRRASTIVHEAHHADGYFHVSCGDARGPECDADLNGPFGFAVLYKTMALQGSAKLLSDVDLALLEGQSCYTLQTRFKTLPPVLLEKLRGLDCQSFSAEEVRVMEELQD